MIPFSDEDLLEPTKQILSDIEPMLKADGGGIDFLGIKDGVVYVRLKGACDGCPSASQTLKYSIERRLKIEIHPEISVKNLDKNEDIKF